MQYVFIEGNITLALMCVQSNFNNGLFLAEYSVHIHVKLVQIHSVLSMTFMLF